MTQVSGSFHLRTAPASGKQGCLSRVFQGWKSARVYYADAVQDTAATSPDGIRYQDFVAIASTANQSGYKVYRCLRKHSNHEPGATGSGAYWSEVSAEARDAFFTFLIAQQASIQMLTGSQFVIYNEQGDVVAGMGNNDDAYIWAGLNKEFLVMPDGSFRATKADVEGIIKAKAMYTGWGSITAGADRVKTVGGVRLLPLDPNVDDTVLLRKHIRQDQALSGVSMLLPSAYDYAGLTYKLFPGESNSIYIYSRQMVIDTAARGAMNGVCEAVTLGGTTYYRIKYPFYYAELMALDGRWMIITYPSTAPNNAPSDTDESTPAPYYTTIGNFD